jgi:FkbM family methyltransferase
MQNVLIDIGAHFGESLEEALRPIYKIDRVYAIEPSTIGINKLLRFKDKRLKIFPIALSDYNGKVNLFSAGSVGGTLFSDKKRHWKNIETVPVFKFSEFALSNLNKNDNIYLKINVEGSELFILKEILKIYQKINFKSILLSIDIEKVPSLAKHRNELYELILHFPIRIAVREDKEINFAMNKFLIDSGLKSDTGGHFMRDIFRSYLPCSRNLLRIIKPIFPKKFWIFVALKLGPNHAR